jgi:hypothetical protein
MTVKISDPYGSSIYSFNVFVINNPPSFAATISSPITAHVSSALPPILLPAYSDPDLHTLALTVTETGLASLPVFITFSTVTHSFSVAPTL